MKFSEISTDKALDIICEITPYVMNISSEFVERKELLEEMKKFAKENPDMSNFEMASYIVEKLNDVLPLIIRNRKSDVFGIIGAVNGVSVEYVAQQSFLTTLCQLKEIFDDKEFLAFFK